METIFLDPLYDFPLIPERGETISNCNIIVRKRLNIRVIGIILEKTKSNRCQYLKDLLIRRKYILDTRGFGVILSYMENDVDPHKTKNEKIEILNNKITVVGTLKYHWLKFLHSF